MMRGRFSEEQIVKILQEKEQEHKTGDICRKHGIGEATYYKWKSKYSGMSVSDVHRLKSLEAENRRLHQLLQRDGFTINHKKVYRLYREEGLQVKQRQRRKRAVGRACPKLCVNLERSIKIYPQT